MKRIALIAALLLIVISTSVECQQTLWTRYEGGIDPYECLKVSHNDSIIFLGGELRAISRFGGRSLWISHFPQGFGFLEYFDISPDDSLIVCTTLSIPSQDTCRVFLISAATGIVIRQLGSAIMRPVDSPYVNVGFTNEGASVYIGSDTGILLYDSKTGNSQQTFVIGDSRRCLMTNDGKHGVTAPSGDTVALLWNLTSTVPTAVSWNTGTVRQMSLASDNTKVLIQSSRGPYYGEVDYVAVSPISNWGSGPSRSFIFGIGTVLLCTTHGLFASTEDQSVMFFDDSTLQPIDTIFFSSDRSIALGGLDEIITCGGDVGALNLNDMSYERISIACGGISQACFLNADTAVVSSGCTSTIDLNTSQPHVGGSCNDGYDASGRYRFYDGSYGAWFIDSQTDSTIGVAVSHSVVAALAPDASFYVAYWQEGDLYPDNNLQSEFYRVDRDGTRKVLVTTDFSGYNYLAITADNKYIITSGVSLLDEATLQTLQHLNSNDPILYLPQTNLLYVLYDTSLSAYRIDDYFAGKHPVMSILLPKGMQVLSGSRWGDGIIMTGSRSHGVYDSSRWVILDSRTLNLLAQGSESLDFYQNDIFPNYTFSDDCSHLLAANNVDNLLSYQITGAVLPQHPSSVTSSFDEGKTGLSLLPAYPDPSHAQTTISFFLPQPSKVTLSISDVTGHITMLTPSQWMDAGEHEVLWDASLSPSGIYLCHLMDGVESVTNRILVLH